ncbi:hypothetical protein MHYP_G00087050 [Metynnis hypsauchen]
MPAKKAVMAQKESATEENRQASSFADSSTTGATSTATDIERVCELLQTFMSEQRSKDESIQREMTRQEQRWRSLQHQFGLLQREVQKGQFMAETSDTREEEQERQTQTRILRSSQSAVLTQPQQPEQLPAQMKIHTVNWRNYTPLDDPHINRAPCGPARDLIFRLWSFQINEEFRRITTVSLEQRFMDKLDHYSPDPAALMKAEGGAVGTKLRPHLDKLCPVNNRSDVTEHILKILVIHGAHGEDPVDVSVLLDGAEILPGCCNTVKACALLLGLIYALNLASPPTLQYTFEVFQ